MSLHRFIATATVAALLCCTGAAQADITTYTSQSAYLAAVGNTGVDTFDDLIRETYPGPFARTAGEHAYTVTTGPANPDLRGASHDQVDFWLRPVNRTDTVTFNLSGDVAGAGGFFFGSNIYAVPTYTPTMQVTATDSLGSTLTYTLVNPHETTFLGFVSTADLVSIALSVGDLPRVWLTINDFHVSAAIPAVPEPATCGMLAAGLAVMGMMARRRRNV